MRQDNEIEGTKGNADLKPERHAGASLSHSWMPNGIFSLSSHVVWELIHDEVVPYWHDNGTLMVKDWINGGDYNNISLSIAPSLSLLGGNLNIQMSLYFAHERHSGIRRFAF